MTRHPRSGALVTFAILLCIGACAWYADPLDLEAQAETSAAKPGAHPEFAHGSLDLPPNTASWESVMSMIGR